MDPLQQWHIRRYGRGRARAITDEVITETRVVLDVNDGRYRIAMLCLPQDLDALAVGLLYSEGALRRLDDLDGVEVSPGRGVIRIRGEFNEDALEAITHRWTRGTGCGGGGTAVDADALRTPLPVGPAVRADALLEAVRALQRRESLWRWTGGVHVCALASADGITALAEDVGRHNAFDKTIGRALLDGVSIVDRFMVTTGRLSGGIVAKALACRIPILVSRSAVTSLGIELARRFSLTLVGFARGGRLNVYSGFERLAGGPADDAGGKP